MREAVARGLRYQQRAEESYSDFIEKSMNARDLFLVPSAVSLSGLALVAHGTTHFDTLTGVNEVAAGRGMDLLDGFLARALEQETETGSCVDVIADKAAVSIMAAAAWKYDIVPRHILTTAAVSNITNASLSTAATLRHPEAKFRPSTAGKHSMALFNASILSHAYASAL